MRDILRIRLAVVDDMETILGIIGQAAEWLGTKGTDQWARPWPDEESRNARIYRGIQNGITWVVEDHGELVATITSRQNGNRNLWTGRELSDPAVYVSRLVVSREYAGNEIGAALVDWAGYGALRTWQAQWIRIDVWTTNLTLHSYYETRGFRQVRICDFDDPDSSYPSAALFQKPTAEVDEAAAARFAAVHDALPGATPTAWSDGRATPSLAAPSDPPAGRRIPANPGCQQPRHQTI
jgi:GNAT superfamily N-acetyltransferase